jgi:ABC-2 type transport system permease protein
MKLNWVGLYTFTHREVRRFLRVSVQTLMAPWISAVLFIFIFGQVVGSQIGDISGVPYIQFVLPGILMMNVLTSSFSHSSSSLYFQRFARHIEEVLVAPLSHAEMIMGYMSGALIRGALIGIGILVIGVFFGAANMYNLPLFVFYILAVSSIFGLLGLIVGLWAKGFEQLSVLTAFVITPLSFLGGMFNSVSMLSPALQAVVHWNPIFYFNDGLRYSMTGFHEAPIEAGMAIIIILFVVLFATVVTLFKKGWRLRS